MSYEASRFCNLANYADTECSEVALYIRYIAAHGEWAACAGKKPKLSDPGFRVDFKALEGSGM